MIVVSDTTPLISLMKIGKLDLVANLFGEIQVPEAVYYELVSNTKFPAESKMIRESPFIKKVSVADIKAVELLRLSLIHICPCVPLPIRYFPGLPARSKTLPPSGKTPVSPLGIFS